MICRLCMNCELGPMPFSHPDIGEHWLACGKCGSHCSMLPYDPGIYTPAYEKSEVAATGGIEACRQQVSSNCDWYKHYADAHLPKDFLDVGTGDGAALNVMQDREGYSVHGFETYVPSYNGSHITVGKDFNRWLFPQRYTAVLCREVIEHVADPLRLLNELRAVTEFRGLVQIQTPTPIPNLTAAAESRLPISAGYQRAHLNLISPNQLQLMIESVRFRIVDKRFWPGGQAYLCRAN